VTRPPEDGAVLEVRDLTVTAPGAPAARIVRGVDWAVRAGGTLAVVGESGSGKSMSALAATGLAPAAARVSGRVLLRGEDLLAMSTRDLNRTRGRRIGFVFQDPMTSLNPLIAVGRQVSEAGEHHLGWSSRQGAERAIDLLEMVGIPDPRRRAGEYPHQFSGGMRQRVMIAMALSCEPELLIADEPTTALDVTTQAQIVELVAGLQQRMGTAVLWITHDLGVVAGIADEVAVMYGGQIVEHAGVDGSLPRLGRPDVDLVAIPGAPPSPRELPVGCVFAPRCPVLARGDGEDRCATEVPDLLEVHPGHSARTWCSTQGAA